MARLAAMTPRKSSRFDQIAAMQYAPEVADTKLDQGSRQVGYLGASMTYN
jgi:hypothetical protein